MRRIVEVIVLLSVALKGYGQCETDQLVIVDAAMNQIDKSELNERFIWNDGRDTIFLDGLYSLDFSRKCGTFSDETDPIPLKSADSTTISFCAICEPGAVKIVDSIDLNQDGVKEVILQREWYCSVTPSNIGPYGVGGQQQSYSRYEIWDVNTKQKIAEVNNKYEAYVAITTNVMQDFGYRFDVKINKDGSILLSNLFGRSNELEMGTYKYDAVSKTYKRIGI